MGSEVLKLGFIGGGLNSAVGYTHMIASQMDHRWELNAGCFSSQSAINKATGEKWGVSDSRIYDSWAQMLEAERGQLDAVVVLTPTPSHAEMVIAALENGHAVICEKALVPSVKEARDIQSAIEKNKSFLAVTYNYTSYPMLRELKDLIETGELGAINHIQIEMPQEGFARLDSNGNIAKPQTWRLTDGIIPTISLDLGVHLHNIVHFLSGQSPVDVVSDQTNFGWFENIADNVMCIARYTNGLRCQMWYSKSALGYRNGLRVRVFGKKGSAEWYQMQPEDIILHTITGECIIKDRASATSLAASPRYNRFKAGHPAGFIEAFANLYVDMADALVEFKQYGRHSNPWVFGIGHALEGLEMFEAIAASAKSNCWEKVSKYGVGECPKSMNLL